MSSQSKFVLLQKVLPSVYKSVTRNLGLRNYRDVAQHLWELMTFDWRLGVSTSGVIPATKLQFEDDTAMEHAVRYRGSPSFSVRSGIATLESKEESFADMTFVDYGCGAGRVMLIAAELGFRHVIGLELSPGLVSRCQSNMARYAARNRAGTRFEVLRRNAMEYFPDPSARVFFFFHPFDQEILNGVLSQIESSIDAAPRQVYVLTFQARDYDFSKTRFSLPL